MLLFKRDKALHDHFEAMAKDPYKRLADLQDAEAARLRVKAIAYNAEVHPKNPWNESAQYNVTERARMQSELETTNPELAAFYKAEARPLRLPFQLNAKNQTVLAQISVKAPILHALCTRALEIQRIWLNERLAFAKTAAEKAVADRAAIERQLDAEWMKAGRPLGALV